MKSIFYTVGFFLDEEIVVHTISCSPVNYHSFSSKSNYKRGMTRRKNLYNKSFSRSSKVNFQ